MVVLITVPSPVVSKFSPAMISSMCRAAEF